MKKLRLIVLGLIFAASFVFTYNIEAKQTISPIAMKHIKDRHWYSAKKGPNTSHFKRSMTAKKLNKLATTTLKRGSQRSSTQTPGFHTYQYTFRNSIGRTTNNQKAYSLRVVTSPNNKIVTAFPVN